MAGPELEGMGVADAGCRELTEDGGNKGPVTDPLKVIKMRGSGGMSRVNVGCQKVAKVKRLGGDFAGGWCVLPINGKSSGRRGAVACCQNSREFGMHERGGGAAKSCRRLSRGSRNMGRLIPDMSEMVKLPVCNRIVLGSTPGSVEH